MWLDDLVQEIAVEFLNASIITEDGETRFDRFYWEREDLFEGCALQISFDFQNEHIPSGVYVDMVDLNHGDRVVGSGYANGIAPKDIGKAIKAARRDFLDGLER